MVTGMQEVSTNRPKYDKWSNDLKEVRRYDQESRMTVGIETHEMMPPMATKTPITDLSPTARPDVSQPNATMEQVFT
jgi:hypothetical protein